MPGIIGWLALAAGLLTAIGVLRRTRTLFGSHQVRALTDDGGRWHTVELPLDFVAPRTELRPRDAHSAVEEVSGERDVLTLPTALRGRLFGRGDAMFGRALQDALLVQALEEVVDAEGELWLTEQRLQLRYYRGKRDVWQQRLERVAGRLRHALEADWRRVAERWGLACPGADPRVLEGVFDGGRLSVRAEGGTAWAPGLRIERALRDPLPPGTVVAHPAAGPGPSVRLADPVLDHLHLSTPSPERLAERLCRDAVRAPLMELVHAEPGARVEAEQIEVVLPAPVEDIVGWVARIVALEAALRLPEDGAGPSG